MENKKDKIESDHEKQNKQTQLDVPLIEQSKCERIELNK